MVIDGQKNAPAPMKFGTQLSHPDGRIPFLDFGYRSRALALPARYDFDDTHPGIQMSVFGNDTYGDCVMAARANHTLRLAYGPNVQISADEVVQEYMAENAIENNGTFLDNGLLLPDSLSRWQVMGWKAGGMNDRKIHSYYQVPWQDATAVCTALFSHMGVQITLDLPTGLNNWGNYGPGHPWNDVSARGEDLHTILLTGYDANGPIGITWGYKQNLSWLFLKTFCTEAYAVVPQASTLRAMNSFLAGEIADPKDYALA